MSRETQILALANAVAQALGSRAVYVPAPAQAISYSSAVSGLGANNVQDALDAVRTLATVQSINGKTGTPVLTAADVGADPTGTAAAALTTHVTGPDPHPQYAPRNNTVLTGYTKISQLTIGNDSVCLYLPGTPGTLGLRTGVSGSERYFFFHADGRLEVANGGLLAAGVITGQVFMSDYTDSGAHRGLYRTSGNENRGFYDDGTDYRVGAGTSETGVWKKIWHEGNFDPATKQAALGYTPVRQGGGIGQLGNTILIGWSGSKIKIQVDNTDFGALATESWANGNLVKLNGDQTIAGKLTASGITDNNVSGAAGWAYSITYSGTGIGGIWNDGSSITLMNTNGGWNRSSVTLRADGGVAFHGVSVGFDSSVTITTSGLNTSFKIADSTNGGNLWLVGAGTNPNKPIRVSNTGDLEFLNSAYSAVVARISDAGSVMSLGGFSPRGSIGLDYLSGGTRLMIRADGANATIDAVNNANSAFDVLRLRGTGLLFNSYRVTTEDSSGNVVISNALFPGGGGYGFITALDPGNYRRIKNGGNNGFEAQGDPAGPADLQRAVYMAVGAYGGGYSVKDNAGSGIYYGGIWAQDNSVMIGVSNPGANSAVASVALNNQGGLTIYGPASGYNLRGRDDSNRAWTIYATGNNLLFWNNIGSNSMYVGTSGNLVSKTWASFDSNGAFIAGNGSGLQFNGNLYLYSRPNVVNATANAWVTMPRIFVQAGDPGNAASDGDLWIW